jgi:serralysin
VRAELTERADPLIFKAMSWPALSCVVFAAIALPGQTSGPAATAISYRSMQGATYDLHAWVGRNVALLTREEALDAPTMDRIVAALDSAFAIYSQITGRAPNALQDTTLNGRDIVAEVPDGKTCGAGCGYLGANGVEVTSTYFQILYQGVKNNNEYDQVVFYEFGRNFWSYGDQLGKLDPFVTEFAIVNRFISIDRAGLKGGPFRKLPYLEFKRSIVGELLSSYLATSDLNWQNTLLIGKAPPNPNNWSASDLAAGMFYKIYSDFGWEKYKAFWKAMRQLPKANTPDDAVRNFLSAAITATGSDYQLLFKAARAHPSNRFP